MSARKPIGAALLFVLLLGALWAPSLSQAAFGIKELSVNSLNKDGFTSLLAGSHPFELRGQPRNEPGRRRHPGRDASRSDRRPAAGPGRKPPRGTALPRGCLRGPRPPLPRRLPDRHRPPSGSRGSMTPIVIPVYNLTPPFGVPASIGFSVINENSFQEASLRQSDYGVRVSDITIPTAQRIISVKETIWGVPAEKSHDAERFCLQPDGSKTPGCASNIPPEAFLSLPTSCGAPLQLSATVLSVQEPENPQTESVVIGGPERQRRSPPATSPPSNRRSPQSPKPSPPTRPPGLNSASTSRRPNSPPPETPTAPRPRPRT